MPKKNRVEALFEQYYQTVDSVDFKEEFLKDGRWYDNINSCVEMDSGQILSSYDFINKKKLLLIGTRLGVVVIYNTDETHNHYKANFPSNKLSILKLLIGGPVLSYSELNMILVKNLGTVLDNFHRELTEN